MNTTPTTPPAAMRSAGLLLTLILAAQFMLHLPFLTERPVSIHTWRMADTGAMAKHWIEDGYPGFKMRIDWDRGESGYVQTELPVYTWLLGLVWTVAGQSFRLAQLLSLGLAVLAFYCFYRFSRLFVGDRVALLATALLATQPLVFYFTWSVQPESLLLLVSYGSLWAWASWLRQPRPLTLLVWALAVFVSLTIKPQTLLLTVVMYLLARREGGQAPQRWVWPAIALITVLALTALWFFYGHEIYLRTNNSFGITTGGGADKFSVGLHLGHLNWYAHVVRFTVFYIVAAPLVPFLAIGVVAAWKDPGLRFIVAWAIVVLLSFMILAEAVWVMNYYMLPLGAPAALLTALGLDRAWNVVRRPAARPGGEWLLAGLAVVALLLGGVARLGALDPIAPWLVRTLGNAKHAPLDASEADRLVLVSRNLFHTLALALMVWGVLIAFAAGASRRWLARPLSFNSALILLLLTATPLAAGESLRKQYTRTYQGQLRCGLEVAQLFPPRTLGVLGHQVYHRPTGYDPEPVIFWYSNTHGWIVPDIYYSGHTLDSLITRGAVYFATNHLEILYSHPDFVEELDKRGDVIARTGDYVIYRFHPVPPRP